MAIQHGWSTRQVDFSNAFVQATLEEEVYVELPAMFCDENENGRNDGVVLKLEKSLYGLVQAPRYWYHHLQAGLTKLNFKPSTLDARIYYVRRMILITYVNNILLFGTDLQKIEQTICELEGLGYGLIREEEDETTSFAFLGVSITPDPVKQLLRLTQGGLIQKILDATGMIDCNTKGSSSTISPLGTDAGCAKQKEIWKYASIIGMMM